MARLKVKLRTHHDDAHLQTPKNVPTKYQLPTPYGFQDIAQTRFSNSRLLQQGKDFIGQNHYGKVIGQIKVTP